MFDILLKFIRFFLKSVGANWHVFKKSSCHGTHGTHPNEDPDNGTIAVKIGSHLTLHDLGCHTTTMFATPQGVNYCDRTSS